MTKHKSKKKRDGSISIDGNAEDSNIFIGNSNTFHETNFTVNNNNYSETEGDTYYHDTVSDAKDEISREIRETILVSILTGVCLSLSWSRYRDFIDLIPYASAILIAILFSIFRVIKLGLRHSFVVGSFIGIAFTGWIYLMKQLTAMDYLASEAIIIAILGNSLLGIMIGAVVGFYVSIRRPFDI